jgi:hypothetical protein
MADLTTIDMKNGLAASAAVTADSLASSQTVPYGKSGAQFIRVYNGLGSAYVATITLKAPTAAGKTGSLAGLGDYAITVADGATKYISLAESARYMDMSTGLITITGAVTGGSIGNVKLEFVQYGG